jgi:glutamate racemase
MKYNRIGVFDSGIGGLTVLKQLLSMIPGIDMVYFGDTARVPYGPKSSKTIIYYTLKCAEFLVAKEIDMLVIACNTASAHAIPALKEKFNIPIVGVIETGSSAAVDAGGSKIGVIGTISTIKSKVYEKTIHELAPNIEIIAKPCPLFVPLVEEGLCDDEITELAAKRYLTELIGKRIDTLLLGCTHYPLLKSVIKRVIGDKVRIVDSAKATAVKVAEMVGEDSKKQGTRDVSFYLTDLTQNFITTGELFLGQKMEHVYEVNLEI